MAVKSWLLLQFAKDPDISIASGFEVLYLSQAIEKIRQLTTSTSSEQVFPSTLELTLAVELEIRKMVSAFSELPEAEQQLWRPVLFYLKVTDPSSLSRKSERRLVLLSEKIAHLFNQYGTYGTRMVAQWKKEKFSEGWQQQLWQQIFNESSPWSYPGEALINQKNISHSPLANVHVYLFALSFVSRLHHAFLVEASAAISIDYFLLSPCRAFWSDIQSDREQQRMQRRWKAQGLDARKQELLEEYMR